MEFVLIALIGLIYLVPILSRQSRTYLRQNKLLRLFILFSLFLCVFLLPSLFYFNLGISLLKTYGCVDRRGHPTEDNLHYSYCDDKAVFAQYSRELLFQRMLPPILRADEICWTVDAGRFCESPTEGWGWQEYLTRSGLSTFAASLGTIFLWALIHAGGKTKRGGEPPAS